MRPGASAALLRPIWLILGVLPSVLSPSPAKLDFGDITAGQRHVLFGSSGST